MCVCSNVCVCLICLFACIVFDFQSLFVNTVISIVTDITILFIVIASCMIMVINVSLKKKLLSSLQ